MRNRSQFNRSSRMFSLVLFFSISSLARAISSTASSRAGRNITQCNEQCGNMAIPYPFYVNSDFCGLSGFNLGCKGGILNLEVNKINHTVLRFSSNGITIDPLHGSCSQNLKDFTLKNTSNFAISSENFVQFSDCENRNSNCSLQCNIPIRNDKTQCNFNETCCYALTNRTIWPQGSQDFEVFEYLKCKGFISWVLNISNNVPNLDAEYGIKLEWAVQGTCDDVQCDPQAQCSNAPSVHGGVRCNCKDGYEGDGFARGGGCVRVCTKHGEKAYGSDCKNQHTVRKILFLSAGIIAGATLVAASFISFALYKRQKVHYLGRRGHGDGSQLASLLPMCSQDFNSKLFSYRTLEKATKGFAATEKCGHGACGTVYEGKLQDGCQIAIKRIHFGSSHGVDQLLNEISVLSTVKHKNLVQLLGCCLEVEDPILVYEFVPNGTLAEHLQRERGEGLSWVSRIRIVCDAADALAYLHSTLNPPIYHRDVKSCNILLDFDFICKVADFGLSRLVLSDGSHISTVPQGTPGYIDPEYHQNFHLTDKSDVYSFGVVLIEIITAKKPVDFSRDQKEVNLASMALTKIANGCLDDIIDPFLQVDRHPSVRALVQRVAELAFRCLSYDKDARPAMVEVAQELQLIKKDSMPLEELQQKEFPKPPEAEGNESPDKVVGSPTSVQALWPSNSTTPSDSLS